MSVFGAQHGGDLPQIRGVTLLLHAAGEGDGDDSLCDVDQVQLVALLQGLQQTHTPGREIEKRLTSSGGYWDESNSDFSYPWPHCAKTKLKWTAGARTIAGNLIPRSNAAHVIYIHVLVLIRPAGV